MVRWGGGVVTLDVIAAHCSMQINVTTHVCVCVSRVVGHGLSEGDRVHIDTIETYARDVIQHVERLKVQHPTLPVFLFGHSMVSCKDSMPATLQVVW